MLYSHPWFSCCWLSVRLLLQAMEIDKHKMEVKASQLRSNINLGPGPGLGGMGSSSMNRPMGMDMDSGGCVVHEWHSWAATSA